jgi:UDP-2-acetamido-3-amino-2,3-dideoxy-glucuronate N-acetyltransferase
MKHSVLFVCTANQCRSPMAAALFARLLEHTALKGEAEWQIASAGTWAKAGIPAIPHAITAMRELGVSIEHHRSQAITGPMLARFDLVLAMCQDHLEGILAEFPALTGKVFLLSQMSGQRFDIEDPAGGPLSGVRVVAKDLDMLLGKGLERIMAHLRGAPVVEAVPGQRAAAPQPKLAAPRIHPSAEVSEHASIASGTSIWNNAQVRSDVHIGESCVIGKNVYIDAHVTIGSRVKIQNNVSIFHGVTIDDGVFVGPHVCFTNDMQPRAINPDGTLKGADNWQVTETFVAYGAAIGANATIRCGVRIGQWAMIGAGSVVTRDVPDYGLVLGNPARLQGYVCPCGNRLDLDAESLSGVCPACANEYPLQDSVFLRKLRTLERAQTSEVA